MHNKSRVAIATLGALVLALACAVAFFALGPRGGDGQPGGDGAPAGAGGLVVPERPDMIDVIAYESVPLVAGEAEQRVNLDNPVGNDAWLRITLELADGEVLWQSERLQPGQVVRAITLARPLEAGDYDAVLRYEHWANDGDMTPLNGAELLVRLEVS